MHSLKTTFAVFVLFAALWTENDGRRWFRWRHRSRVLEGKNLTCIADSVPSVLEASFTNCTINQPSFATLSAFLQIFECVFEDFGLLDQNGIINDQALGNLSESDLNATLTFVLNDVIGKASDILRETVINFEHYKAFNFIRFIWDISIVLRRHITSVEKNSTPDKRRTSDLRTS